MTSVAESPVRIASPGASLRDALLAVGALMTLLVLVELAVPSSSRAGVANVVDAVSVAAFTVTGLTAWHRRPHNATGRLMVATAAALWAAGMQDDEIAVLRHIGTLLDSLPLALLLHLLLAFPSGRLVGRAAHVTVAVAYVVALLPPVAQDLVRSAEAQTSTGWTQTVVGLSTLVVSFVLATRRLSRTPPVVRRQLLPFVGYGCFSVAVLAVCIAITHSDVSIQVLDATLVVQVAVVCGLPVAFVVALTVGAFGRAGEVEEVARGISDAATEPRLLDELMARALGDTTARVLWADRPGSDAFVDSDGSPYDLQNHIGWWPVGAPPVGGLSYDRTLIADTGIVATVAAPLELAIDNHRLVVDLRSAVQRLDEAANEIRTSRRRIVVAADAERRRIARDLHDGAQQRIMLAGLEVQRIGRRAEDADLVRSMATQVSGQIRSLVDDLRSLVQGIMPTTLQERGLAAAVQGLADQIPLPVHVQVVGALGRLDADVESTAYFVVAEALTNALKHAAAHEITVRLAAAGGRLRIVVTDDGLGAGDAAPGFGLRGLQDRVAALDGTVTLRPASGGGSTLTADLACG